MNQLENMSLEELWELFPIILSDHNPKWKLWANDEMKFLKELISPIQADMHHIGSTAIENILSKPIVDIIIVLDNCSFFDDIKHILTDAGYICMSETDKRISFNKGYTAFGYAEKVFHVHVRTKNDVDEIYFRDYLNAHKDIATQYEALKLSLMKKYRHDRDKYTQAKTTFVKKYTLLAKELSGKSVMRPTIGAHSNVDSFLRYYYLKEEMIAFLREKQLPVYGNKEILKQRIINFISCGTIPASEHIDRRATGKLYEICDNKTIGPDFICSDAARTWFVKKIGRSFKFKVSFQKWLKANPDATYADACIAYRSIIENTGKTQSEIAPQFEYNRYIRDFFKENPGKKLSDAIKCWNYRKNQPGLHCYNKEDLDILL